eukprot:CAMPEP_0118874868 /NCGR_PEP_ID=MMETSP1163-20130328/16152_1 /TAXON_ID=124430 /ORGANISM="Phaeomonas parva, Strain CCMP2877" /LENGTH=214 /DNA_ID=CAMNT_0006810305 /DNA_START=98 /DNA_END=740 /DNA_ORIENTATION=+
MPLMQRATSSSPLLGDHVAQEGEAPGLALEAELARQLPREEVDADGLVVVLDDAAAAAAVLEVVLGEGAAAAGVVLALRQVEAHLVHRALVRGLDVAHEVGDVPRPHAPLKRELRAQQILGRELVARYPDAAAELALEALVVEAHHVRAREPLQAAVVAAAAVGIGGVGGAAASSSPSSCASSVSPHARITLRFALSDRGFGAAAEAGVLGFAA